MRRLALLFCMVALAGAAQMLLRPVRVGPQEPPALNTIPPPRVDPAAGPVTTEWIAVGGRQRSYILAQPEVAAPHPTVIALHGTGGSADRMAVELGLLPSAQLQGFAAVFPQGQVDRWNFYPPGLETEGFVERTRPTGGLPDDVGFIRAIVGDLIRRGIADPQRIYLAGTSNGGFMALRMVCLDAKPFAAVGLLISGMPDVIGTDCAALKPIPAIMIKGTADPIVPYDGGLIDNLLPVWSTRRLVEFVRRINGCGEPARDSILPRQGFHEIQLELSRQCSGGPVAFYRIIGGGHVVPANAGHLLLDFFRDKAR
jgi:polyhydroxybutyrate depolymerase